MREATQTIVAPSNFTGYFSASVVVVGHARAFSWDAVNVPKHSIVYPPLSAPDPENSGSGQVPTSV